MEYEGYRKIRAVDLTRPQQERLRRVLQRELTEALIRSIRASPPEIDIAEVQLVLRPGQGVGDGGTVADCVTCITCVTCVTS